MGNEYIRLHTVIVSVRNYMSYTPPCSIANGGITAFVQNDDTPLG